MLLRTVIIATAIYALALQQASAACVCRCVNGSMTLVCEHPFDPRPICLPSACRAEPQIPSPGAANCSPEQVFNPRTGRFEPRTICN
jgi:hypothetical protein